MKKIVVAGGGLVGCLVSVVMKKLGHQVLLLEKRPDIRKANQEAGRSINLVVTSRGLNALKNVGLMHEVMPLTVPVTGRMIHAKNGDTNYQAYGRDPSECNLSVSRLQLNRFLLSACEKQGVEIVFDAPVESADLKNKKLMYKNAKGLVTVDYEVLLGTDGAGSVLRKSMKKAMGESFQEATEFLSADYKELFLPLAPSEKASLEKNALHIWPRGSHMLMALPNLDGSFTMTLYLPRETASASFAELSNPEKVKNFLQSEFPDAYALMPQATEDFLKNPQGVLGTVRASPWVYQDSMALLGDAAHAIVPFFGQGMNLGFEDCTYLEKFLRDSDGDWLQALKKFDDFQRPNANAIAEMALENFFEMRDQVGNANFQMQKKIEARIEKEMPEIYRSRYGMITYTLIPYALAQEAGRIQEEILRELSPGLKSDSDLDMELARSLVQKKLVPFIEGHKLSLEKFSLK